MNLGFSFGFTVFVIRHIEEQHKFTSEKLEKFLKFKIVYTFKLYYIFYQFIQITNFLLSVRESARKSDISYTVLTYNDNFFINSVRRHVAVSALL